MYICSNCIFLIQIPYILYTAPYLEKSFAPPFKSPDYRARPLSLQPPTPAPIGRCHYMDRKKPKKTCQLNIPPLPAPQRCRLVHFGARIIFFPKHKLFSIVRHNRCERSLTHACTRIIICHRLIDYWCIRKYWNQLKYCIRPISYNRACSIVIM